MDTCTLLWLADADTANLSSNAIQVFQAPSNDIAVSVISLWEIAMKASVGKLAFPGGSVTALMALCARQSIDVFPLTPDHIQQFLAFPPAHPDVFDRLIAAVSIHETTDPQIILSPDTAFDAYSQFGVTRAW